MKKYFLKPLIIMLVVLFVILSATAAFACSSPGSGSMVIAKNRLSATATTTGKIHTGEGAYHNHLTAKPTIVTYFATDPSVTRTTVSMPNKDLSNISSVTSSKTVSSSTVIESGKNKWSATCRTSGKTVSGTATAK